jgi:hypothetical protein
MSDANGERRSSPPRNNGGVLVNLPSTRPQRSSPRRAAARKSAQEGRATGGAKPHAPERPKRATRKPASADRAATPKRAGSLAGPPAGRPRTGSGARREAAPRQGFESDSEAMTGSLRPPGGLELAASAAELVGELAKAGLSTGERLLRDAFSRLPGT